MSIRRYLAVALACHILCVGSSCTDEADSTVTTAPNKPRTIASTKTTPSAGSKQRAEPRESNSPETADDKTQASDSEPAAETTPSKPADAAPAEKSEAETAEAASESEEQSRQELLERVSDGVVLVKTFDARGEEEGFGSGCVVGDDLILTNYHVISTAVSAKIQLNDEEGNSADADSEMPVAGFVAVDEVNDLALIRVEGLPDELHRFEIAEPGTSEKFEEVIAIGHPDGLKFSVTRGFVNAALPVSELPEEMQYWMRSENTRLIQTDAVVSPGSSGGPLLNRSGEVVGINTLQVEGTRFAFAVEATHIQKLMKGEKSEVSELPVPGADVLVTKGVATLQYDFFREWFQLIQDVQLMTAEEDMEAFRKLVQKNNPAPGCAQQCLELVQNYSDEAEAIDALMLSAEVVQTATDQLGEGAWYYFDQALVIAAEDPKLRQSNQRLVNSLIGVGHSQALEDYLRTVMRDSTDEQIRAAAGVALATSYYMEATPEYQADLQELANLLTENSGSVMLQGDRVEEYLEPILTGNSLTIGSVAPEIVGKDHEGQEFQLSDYRGKVVVLDFWADWCPHCRAMYEHERDMIERLKDEPFVLLGVNSDEPARVERVIESETVTWRSWMDGPDGPISEAWNIQAIPTLYVLDQEGRIRFQDVRGDELEAAIESLLHESEFQFANNVIAADADWKYTTAPELEDGADWKSATFDDAEWSDGTGPMGYGRHDLDTEIKVGSPGERPLALLFRHRFDAPEMDSAKELFLNLRFDDGVAVYLNGEEVYRGNLATDADLATPAVLRSHDRVADHGIGVSIDPKLLKPTDNCLAVELHQISAYNADAVLALTLGTNLPDFAKQAEGGLIDRLKLCRLTGHLADSSTDFSEALQAFAKDESDRVRIAAVIAAAINGQSLDDVEFDTPEAQQMILQSIMSLNLDAWRVARRGNLSRWQYLSAAGMARAGLALREKLPEEIRKTVQGVTNTLGVALYRAGDSEKAIGRLEESIEKFGENPVDAAYLALAHHTLGQSEKADQARENAADLMNAPEWKHHRSGIEALQEVKQTFQDD